MCVCLCAAFRQLDVSGTPRRKRRLMDGAPHTQAQFPISIAQHIVETCVCVCVCSISMYGETLNHISVIFHNAFLAVFSALRGG